MEADDHDPRVEYCWKWNFRRNRIGIPLSESEAERRHRNGEDYIAVLGRSPGTPHPVLVTIAGKNSYASTQFLDEHGRPYILYEFFEKENGYLFLETVYIWNYPSDNPRLSLKDSNIMEEYEYHENGYAKYLAINKNENIKDTTEYTDVPVQNNWEPVPEFGHYTSIARWERR